MGDTQTQAYKSPGLDGAGYTLNSGERLPPVGCSLVILVDGCLVRAVRTGIIAKKTDDMEYRLDDGRLILGRFDWTYP